MNTAIVTLDNRSYQ